MSYSAEDLPPGLSLDSTTGFITGMVVKPGEYAVTLKASNPKGTAIRRFRIRVGETIALTPPMGWNSWNCWAKSVDQGKVLRSAQALVNSGLKDHGWTYINIDDAWQGDRGGSFGGLQGNANSPDMKGLVDAVHGLGLKAGIYSTPWITSYASYPGGSSDVPTGAWSKEMAARSFWKLGRYSFAENEAKQWAAWGFDYLKYDWDPIDVSKAEEMAIALRRSGRDVVFSLSNSAPLASSREWARLANCFRTTPDIWDQWEQPGEDWQYGVSEIGFCQDAWAPATGPGHWADPDMLVLGEVGWGPELHHTRLTPDEQYSHFTLWCLLSAPLLIGCDLERLDPFTLNLLTNDEVLAVDQDALGRQAVRVATVGQVDVLGKDLEDGSRVLGFFNRGNTHVTNHFNKFSFIGLGGTLRARDLWRQIDLPDVTKGSMTVDLNPHGVALIKFNQTKI